MSVEQLIALEAAVAELGTLYVVARSFTALRERAEAELLPQVLHLGQRLRALVRHGGPTPADIDAASREILSQRAQWRAALDGVRSAPVYESALRAFAADDQTILAEVIPKIFTDLALREMRSPLYFSFSATSGRRRPGHSPFLSAGECADRLLATQRDGMVPEAGDGEWWERDLPSLECTDAPGGLESPIGFRLDGATAGVAVFGAPGEPLYRIYTPRLSGPFTVILAADATDEWWEAYDESYHTFRDALVEALATRGVAAEVLS